MGKIGNTSTFKSLAGAQELLDSWKKVDRQWSVEVELELFKNFPLQLMYLLYSEFQSLSTLECLQKFALVMCSILFDFGSKEEAGDSD